MLCKNAITTKANFTQPTNKNTQIVCGNTTKLQLIQFVEEQNETE